MSRNKQEIVYYPFIGHKLLDEPFDLSKGEHSWTQQLKILADKNNIAIHTPDKATYKNVIGVIFFDNLFYHNLDDITDLYNKGLLKKTIYIDYEPPTGHAKKHEPESIKELARLFKYVVTYDDDLAGTANFIKGNVANYYAEPPKSNTPFNKRKMICMITNATSNDAIIHVLNSWNYTYRYNSRKIKYHPKAVYHRRQQIAEYFLAKHPDKMDLFGSYWSDKFSKIHKGPVSKGDKIKKLSEYKFVLTFDSYINQRGYISEKIFDAFFARTVPVYLGASNVKDYIPEECFIDMRDFSSYDELYTYLAKMTPEEYSIRLRAICRFLKSDTFNSFFSSAAIAKTLLSAVKSQPQKNYSDALSEKILAQLTKEREAMRPKKVGVIRLDKHNKEGQWCFTATIRGAADNQISISDKVFKKAGGKLIELKTYLAANLEPDVDEVTMDIPYNDIISNGKESYYVKISGRRSAKLVFFTTDIINNTNVDEKRRFFVRGNTIKVKERRWYS